MSILWNSDRGREILDGATYVSDGWWSETSIILGADASLWHFDGYGLTPVPFGPDEALPPIDLSQIAHL